MIQPARYLHRRTYATDGARPDMSGTSGDRSARGANDER
jgi:hypothetical protein